MFIKTLEMYHLLKYTIVKKKRKEKRLILLTKDLFSGSVVINHRQDYN